MAEYPDCVIDLETMGTRPGNVIVSIGAIPFNLAAGTVSDAVFERTISIADSQKHGFEINGATVQWWMSQSPEAQLAAIKMPGQVIEVLTSFSQWWTEQGCERPWGNGASFDCSMLSFYYDHVGLPCPWRYTQERCYRTISELYRAAVPLHEGAGVRHNAVDDCRYQIERLLMIRSYLMRRK